MSKDSVLKKDFQKNDVERLRNLVQGKYGEKTRSSVGFTNKQEFHNEGDIWESDGRTWTIKEGIKQGSGQKQSRIPLAPCQKHQQELRLLEALRLLGHLQEHPQKKE